MSELELGQATIVYEDPEEGQVDQTVDNERLVYARDHWMVRTGTDEQGNDLMKQIPREHVHSVERNVERFEEQARTVRRRVESMARDIREMLPVGPGSGEEGRRRGRTDREPTRITIDESGEE